MARLFTLKSKLVLLLIATTLLTMLLGGIVFSSSLKRYSEQSARDELMDSAAIVRLELLEMGEQLRESAMRLAGQADLLASVSLIWRYQDPLDYQPLVFDPEKRRLARELAQTARGAGFSLLAVYGADRQPIAFYVQGEESAQPISGYLSFEGQRARPMHLGTDVSDPRPMSLPPVIGEMHLHDEQPGGRARFHVVEGRLFLEVVEPLSRTLQDGRNERMGFLRLAYFVEQPLLLRFAERSRARITIHYDQSVVASHDIQAALPSNLASFPLIELDEQSSGGFRGVAMETEAGSHYEGVTRLPLKGGGEAVMSLAVDLAQLQGGLWAFRRAVLWTLPLSGLLVVVLGLFFVRHSVTGPVAQLTASAKRISEGDFSAVEGAWRRDELGTLANAFNVMVEMLRSREEQLHDKQKQFEGIINNAQAVIYMKDHQGRYLLINNLAEKLFGISNKALRGKTDFDFFPEQTAQRTRRYEQQVMEQRAPLQIEEELPMSDGIHTYLSIKFPLLDGDGQPIAVCSIATDITERKRTEERLQLARMVIEHAQEAVMITDVRGIIQDVNEAYLRITGLSREEVIGAKPSINKSGRHDKAFYAAMWGELLSTGAWQGEIWDRRKNGEIYPKWLSITAVCNERDETINYVGIFSDMTEQKQVERQLESLAYYDSLTGLPNRVLFRERLMHEIAVANRQGTKLALLFIDLDRFKYVNDTLGHNAGDLLLEIVAQRIGNEVRETDTVARLGGDEFTVTLTGLDGPDGVAPVAQKIVDALYEPVVLQNHEVHIGGSIGIAIYPDDGTDIETLTMHADTAMYQAKEKGRNNYQFFMPEMNAHVHDRLVLEAELHQALEQQQFLLYYQPKVELESGQVTGMESLVRWQHPDKGLVAPDQFIPLAEETGLIVPMGEWILNTACRQTAEWSAQLGVPLKVAVNLSARQFQQKDLVQSIEHGIRESGIDPQCLELEITESVVMGDVEAAIEVMKRLRDLGLQLAIDDFGTGYSSLNHLKRFPINTLKIDRSFVRDLEVDTEDEAIVKSVISLGHSLGLTVVAEGVETREQLEFLRQHGCHQAQGYYLYRPLSEERFESEIIRQSA